MPVRGIVRRLVKKSIRLGLEMNSKSPMSLSVPFACLLVSLLASSALDAAERPRFTQVLPGDTLLMVRVRDANALKEDFAKTAIGNMAQDEEVQPIVSCVSDSTIDHR